MALLLHLVGGRESTVRILSLLARVDQGTVGDHFGREASDLYLLRWMLRKNRLLAVLACVDGRTAGNHVGRVVSGLRLLYQMQWVFWLLALLASADLRGVGGYIGCTAILAGADWGSVGDGSWLEARALHCVVVLEDARLLRFLAFLAHADGRAVGDHVWQGAAPVVAAGPSRTR